MRGQRCNIKIGEEVLEVIQSQVLAQKVNTTQERVERWCQVPSRY